MKKNGVTLIELLVVMGMMAIFLTIGGLSLSGIQSGSQMDYVSVQVKDALYQARTKTITGSQTSVYFESDKLTLISGITFDPSDISNIETILPSGLSFASVNFPDSTVVYETSTGYPANYAAPYDVSLQDVQSGKTRIFSINQIGIVEVQ